MTQMVLPQTPAPGAQKDAGAPKPGSARDSGADESRYESVSRAEQKRLDNRQADARRSEQGENSQSASQAEPTSNADEMAKPDKTAVADEGKAAETVVAGNVAEPAAEMEALTAVSVAALTIYDMAKAVDRGMHITDIRVVEKRGGKSGHWISE